MFFLAKFDRAPAHNVLLLGDSRVFVGLDPKAFEVRFRSPSAAISDSLRLDIAMRLSNERTICSIRLPLID